MTIIPLLEKAYGFKETMWQQEEAFNTALSDIELFSISPQIYYLLKQSELLEETPASFQNQLFINYQRGLHHNLFMKHKENELLHIFEKNRMEVMPLKGIRFAEQYFGHFSARVTTDFDLFVPYQQLSDSIHLLESNGYWFEIIKDHHARLHKDSFMVELHWTLDKQYWSDIDFFTAQFWEIAQDVSDFQYVKQLSPLHAFYFICLHGARHQMDSMRYVIDIVQMIHKVPNLDYTELIILAAKDKTSKRIKAVLSIVYTLFPKLHELKPLPFNLIETHWEYTVIKNAKLGVKNKQYYLYKIFFKHFIFDNYKYQIKSIQKSY